MQRDSFCDFIQFIRIDFLFCEEKMLVVWSVTLFIVAANAK